MQRQFFLQVAKKDKKAQIIFKALDDTLSWA